MSQNGKPVKSDISLNCQMKGIKSALLIISLDNVGSPTYSPHA